MINFLWGYNSSFVVDAYVSFSLSIFICMNIYQQRLSNNLSWDRDIIRELCYSVNFKYCCAIYLLSTALRISRSSSEGGDARHSSAFCANNAG